MQREWKAHAITRGDEPDAGDRVDLKGQVAVTQGNALGRPRRARGVEEGGGVGVPTLGQELRLAAQLAPAGASFRAVQQDDAGRRSQSGHAARPVGRREDDPRRAVDQGVGEGIIGELRVQRHHHGAGPDDGERRRDPLRPVRREQGDASSGLQPGGDEPGRELAQGPGQMTVAPLSALGRREGDQRRPLGMRGEPVRNLDQRGESRHRARLSGESFALAIVLQLRGGGYACQHREGELMMTVIVRGSMALVILIIASGCVVVPAPVMDIPPPVPAPYVEYVPVSPGPPYVWVPGYWGWRHPSYVWVPGRYAVPPAPTYVWVSPYWAPTISGHVWIGGHWHIR